MHGTQGFDFEIGCKVTIFHRNVVRLVAFFFSQLTFFMLCG